MTVQDQAARFAGAAAELNQREHRGDGEAIVNALVAGLNVLERSLYFRLHHDVELIVGMDSMLMPVSERRTQVRVEREIELYHVVESTAAVREFQLLKAPADWYPAWLAHLRLGPAEGDPDREMRIDKYLVRPLDQRRLAFADVMSRILPESRRAPLVLFRLFPLAVQVATAQAFSNSAVASDLRKQQAREQPAILDCRQCRGELLEPGMPCRECGNPLWKSQYLLVAD